MVRVFGKGRKERLVPMTQTAADAIRAYLADREAMVRARVAAPERATGRPASRRAQHPLFVNYRGQRLTPRSVHRLVRKYVALCSTRLGSRRTHSATRLRPTCCRAAPTCAASRSCSATRS